MTPVRLFLIGAACAALIGCGGPASKDLLPPASRTPIAQEITDQLNAYTRGQPREWRFDDNVRCWTYDSDIFCLMVKP